MTNAMKLDFLDVHIFCVTGFSGEPKQSNEMLPRWFALDAIPYDLMWVDDRYWLPLFLQGKRFRGRFHFDTDKNEKILKQELVEIL